MKYTIEGFSQEVLVQKGLDAIDAILLRWFIDFKDSGKMKRIEKDGDVYHWIQYQAVIDDLPCLGISNKESLGRRFHKLVKAEVLKLHIHSVGGRFSYFAVNPVGYALLVDSHSTQKSIALDLKVDSHSTQKSGLIDSSTIDSSTKIKEVRHKHGEYQHVLLTTPELERFKIDFPLTWQEMIKNCDEYCQIHDTKYADYNLAMRRWARTDKFKKSERPQTGNTRDPLMEDLKRQGILKASGQ